MEEKITKICTKCNKEKPTSEYYKQKDCSHGYRPACKQCNLRGMREYRQKNTDKLRNYALKKQEAPNYKSKNYFRSAFERKANNKIRTEIRAGRYVRPLMCEACHTQDRLDSHHHDYNKPLEVIWMCRSCHAKYHSGILEEDKEIRKKVNKLIGRF